MLKKDKLYVLHKGWDKTQVSFRKFDCYLPFVPSREQIRVFIRALDDPDARLAASILYATGLRIDELCHLKYTDIYLSNHAWCTFGAQSYENRPENNKNTDISLHQECRKML